jgi:hypothetical protein
MKCPICKFRGIDLNLHSEGFTSVDSPLKQCRSCSCQWIVKPSGRIIILDKGDLTKAVVEFCTCGMPLTDCYSKALDEYFCSDDCANRAIKEYLAKLQSELDRRK